jgi:hypothetical protein
MVSSATFESVTNLAIELTVNGIPAFVKTLQDADIAMVRGIAVTLWYDTVPTSHLLFCDDDMGFEPQLILDMLALNEPLVGAVYPARGEKHPGYPIWIGGPLPTEIPQDSTFLEVEFVGTGVMLIRRDVITGMLEKWPDMSDTRFHDHQPILADLGVNRIIRCFEQMDLPNRARVPEDYSFCLRHRACGGKIFANINHNVIHIGKKAYAGSYLDYRERKAIP